MTVLVRSQQGVPLGVYTGNDVSTFAAKDIPNSTALLIDGKRLFLYRVEFSIYETSLLGDPGTLDKQYVSDSPAASVTDPENDTEVAP